MTLPLFDLNKIKLPCDTWTFLSSSTPKIENFYLQFNLYAHTFSHKGEYKFRLNDKKKETLYALMFNDYSLTKWSDILPQLIARQQNICNSNKGQQNIFKLKIKTDWRFNTGYGEANVYESGISLHHLYGFPIIKESTLKGALRRRVIEKYFENKTDEAEKDNGFIFLFGTGTNDLQAKGHVQFFDAIPNTMKQNNLVLDVTTPHYPEFFKGAKLPADDQSPKPFEEVKDEEKSAKLPTDNQSPKPITFLTLQDVEFTFHFAIEKTQLNIFNESKLMELFRQNELWVELFKEAVDAEFQHGIGIKKSRNYGKFSVLDSEINGVKTQVQKTEDTNTNTPIAVEPQNIKWMPDNWEMKYVLNDNKYYLKTTFYINGNFILAQCLKANATNPKLKEFELYLENGNKIITLNYYDNSIIGKLIWLKIADKKNNKIEICKAYE